MKPLTLDGVFMGVWLALTIGSAWFFWGSRNARLKRAIWPWFCVFAGVLFVLFVVLLTGEFWELAFVVPAVAVISFLNIRLTKFCVACGATLSNHSWFSSMHFCPKCGAPLSDGSRRQIGDGPSS